MCATKTQWITSVSSVIKVDPSFSLPHWRCAYFNHTLQKYTITYRNDFFFFISLEIRHVRAFRRVSVISFLYFALLYNRTKLYKAYLLGLEFCTNSIFELDQV